MEQSLDFNKYLDIVRRRYLYVLIPGIIFAIAATVVARSLPSKYESTATILVEAQLIPDELAASTVTASANERIKVIQQRLFARGNLLEIADKFSLYREGGKTYSPSEIVDAMREAISIEQIDVSVARRGTQTIGFTVTFEYSRARTAAGVANELVTKILSQNVETRLSRAIETSGFFEQQLADLESKLLSTEQQIASFKRDNEDALPETLASRREQLALFKAQLAQLDQQISFMETGDASKLGTGSAASDQLGFKLQSLELSYDTLIKRRETLKPLAEKGFVARARMEELDNQITRTEIELASLKAQMGSQGLTADPSERLKLLKSTRAQIGEKADKLTESIGKTPTVEVQMSALNREYQNLQNQYSLTKGKLVNAQTGERLEQDRQAERFEVIEQATVPEKPASPNRMIISLAGTGAGFALGAGIVLLLELLDGSIRTSSDLERSLQLRAFAVIPYIETAYEGRQRKMKGIWYVSSAVAAVVGVVVAVHILYLPLDLLAERGWQMIHTRIANFI